MSRKDCPHCGNPVAEAASHCPCGYEWLEGIEVPAPDIVRSSTRSKKEKEKTAEPGPLQRKKPQQATQGGRRVGADVAARSNTGTAPRPNEALLMGCPSCGSRISKRAHQCPACGSAPYGHCQVCATPILVSDASCPECGDPDPFGSEPG